MIPFNILENLPENPSEEIIEQLASSGNVRIERIVSSGHRSPDGFWYDQDQDEWVVVLKGRAQLKIEGVEDLVNLAVGDSVLLRAHQRHRVEWTLPDFDTIWLAVHFDSTGTES